MFRPRSHPRWNILENWPSLHRWVRAGVGGTQKQVFLDPRTWHIRAGAGQEVKVTDHGPCLCP